MEFAPKGADHTSKRTSLVLVRSELLLTNLLPKLPELTNPQDVPFYLHALLSLSTRKLKRSSRLLLQNRDCPSTAPITGFHDVASPSIKFIPRIFLPRPFPRKQDMSLHPISPLQRGHSVLFFPSAMACSLVRHASNVSLCPQSESPALIACR